MFHDNLNFIGAAQAELGCPSVKDLVEEIPLVPSYSVSCPFLDLERCVKIRCSVWYMSSDRFI